MFCKLGNPHGRYRAFDSTHPCIHQDRPAKCRTAVPFTSETTGAPTQPLSYPPRLFFCPVPKLAYISWEEVEIKGISTSDIIRSEIIKCPHNLRSLVKQQALTCMC